MFMCGKKTSDALLNHWQLPTITIGVVNGRNGGGSDRWDEAVGMTGFGVHRRSQHYIGTAISGRDLPFRLILTPRHAFSTHRALVIRQLMLIAD
jgi:hypothetical protein